MTSTVPDRIERSVEIDASAEKVWGLISRPGWWINETAVDETTVERRGDLHVAHHPEWGEFHFRIEKLDEPRYAAFRWFDRESDDTTLTEFTIVDRPGGVTLTVVESGFASLGGEATKTRYEGNVEAWELELSLAKRHVEG